MNGTSLHLLVCRLRHLVEARGQDQGDAQLLQAFITNRDEKAFTTLLHRHGAMVYNTCRRLLQEPQDVEDVFQATFLVLLRNARSIRNGRSLGCWLHGIARRLALKVRLQNSKSASDPRLHESPPQHSPADEVTWRELCGVLDEELQRLPQHYRSPLVLCYLEGSTQDEAAAQLGWSKSTLRRRLDRGRALLRARLTRRGVTLSGGLVPLLLTQTASAAVPVRLVLSAAQAAIMYATTGGAVSLSTNAVTLAEGALHAMTLTKLKTATLAVMLVCTALAGVGIVGHALQDAKAQVVQEEQKPTNATPPNVQAKQDKTPARLDLYGDPLPPGAVVRLGTVRYRVPREGAALAFAPDGKTVAVRSGNDVYLFDSETGKRIKHLPKAVFAYKPQNSLVFSADGKRLAARGETLVETEKGTLRRKDVVRVWELAGRAEPHEYEVERAIWLGWSGNAEPLVVCLEKEVVSLRNLANGQSKSFKSKELPRPQLSNFVLCDCAPAGQSLAVVDQENRVIVWDTVTGKERYTIPAKNDQILREMILSANGRQLAILRESRAEPHANAVEIVNSLTGEVVRTVAADQKHVTALAFSADSKMLATVGWYELRFWDVATGREISRSQGERVDAEVAEFSGDGKSLATLQKHTSALSLWDSATGKKKPQPIGHVSGPYGMVFSSDGQRMASGASDGTIHIWNLATSKSLLNILRWGMIRDVAFTRDGRQLYSTNSGQELWISDAATGQKQHVIKLEDPERPDTIQDAISMHLSTDGKTLVALSYYYAKKGGLSHEETLITGWDPTTRKQLFRRRIPGMDWRAVSVDARLLATAFPSSKLDKGPGSGPMRLEDLVTGKHILDFPAPSRQTRPLEFSPDGRLLAANNSNYQNRKKGDPISTGQNMLLWEVATGAQVLSLPTEGQRRVAFSPDGRLMAISAPVQSIVVWDLAQGRELKRFKDFGAEIMGLAFTPDSKRLVSSQFDSTMLIWDVGTPPPNNNKVTANDLDQVWADLAGRDAPQAFKARWALAMSPETALPLLRKHLKPAQPADPQRVQQLIEKLDAKEFAVRNAAQTELEKLGGLAAPALEQAMANNPSLEVSVRVQALLRKLRGIITQPEQLRHVRAIAVLESIATPEARELLSTLAKGAPGARLTQEATAALRRLELRASDVR